MIRPAEQEDIGELAALWARAFPGERTVEQRVRELETGGVFGGIDTAWIAEQGGRTTGACRAYMLTQHMHGTAYAAMGLAAVAVDETARRSGTGRSLCEHAVRIACERGDVLSILYPFRPAFYHALGWGLVGEMHAYRFRPESLLIGGESEVRRASADDSSAIAACYAAVAEHGNGLIARTPRVWRSHLSGDTTHTYLAGDDNVRGYAIVDYGRASSADEKPLFIRELVWGDDAAYRSLLGWVAAQRDAFRVIHHHATPCERFHHRLAEPRPPGFRPVRYLWSPVATVIRGPMLRVLDVPAALGQRRRWGPAMPLRFGLEVHDDLVPGNRGPFIVDFDGRNADVRRGTGDTPRLRMDAPAFAQLFAGELSVTAGIELGSVECDGDAAAVDALFRTDRCFRLLDEF